MHKNNSQSQTTLLGSVFLQHRLTHHSTWPQEITSLNKKGFFLFSKCNFMLPVSCVFYLTCRECSFRDNKLFRKLPWGVHLPHSRCDSCVIHEYVSCILPAAWPKASDWCAAVTFVHIKAQSWRLLQNKISIQYSNLPNCGLRMHRERFAYYRFQWKPRVNYPGIHHGTCVTHVPWCMSGSLTRGGGENVPGIPGAFPWSQRIA